MNDVLKKITVDKIPEFIQSACTLYMRYTIDKEFFVRYGFDCKDIDEMAHLIRQCSKSVAQYEIYLSERKRSSKAVDDEFNKTAAHAKMVLAIMRDVFEKHKIYTRELSLRNNNNRDSFIQMLFSISVLGTKYKELFHQSVVEEFVWAENKARELSKMIVDHSMLHSSGANSYTQRAQLLRELWDIKVKIRKSAAIVFGSDPYRQNFYRT